MFIDTSYKWIVSKIGRNMNMETPMISVIVPVYNVENYLKRCVDTIIGQTYSKLEIILVDDGSTDTSGDICDEYALADERIIVIHKKNGGLSDARNAGLKVKKGEYVFFVDSDDWIHLDTIQILYEKLILCDCDVAIGGFKQETSNLAERYAKICEGEIKVYELSRKQALVEMLKQEKFSCSACGRLFKVGLFDSIEFPVGKLYEDQGTTYRLFLKANKLCFVDLPLYIYFVRSGSIQNSEFKISNMDELEFALKQKVAIDSEYPELRGATAGRLVSTCFHIMFGIDDVKKYQTYYDEALNYVIRYRKQAIFDKKTGKKVKLGCLLSYLGFSFTKRLYCLAGVRGKLVR